MRTKNIIEIYLKEKNMTIKELAEKCNMNVNGLHNKFKRDSISLKDFRTLLGALDKEIQIVDKVSIPPQK